MKNVSCAIALSLVSSVFFSCNKSSESSPAPCGAPIDKQHVYDGSSNLVTDNTQWTEDNIYVSESGNLRIFTVAIDQLRLCVESPVSVSYSAKTSSGSEALVGLNITGRTDWGDGNAREVVLCRITDGHMKPAYEYKAQVTGYSKKGFDNNSGRVKASLVVSFNTFGSLATDMAYFKSKLSELKVILSGRAS
jgi:hypothetical protein